MLSQRKITLKFACKRNVKQNGKTKKLIYKISNWIDCLELCMCARMCMPLQRVACRLSVVFHMKIMNMFVSTRRFDCLHILARSFGCAFFRELLAFRSKFEFEANEKRKKKRTRIKNKRTENVRIWPQSRRTDRWRYRRAQLETFVWKFFSSEIVMDLKKFSFVRSHIAKWWIFSMSRKSFHMRRTNIILNFTRARVRASPSWRSFCIDRFVHFRFNRIVAFLCLPSVDRRWFLPLIYCELATTGDRFRRFHCVRPFSLCTKYFLVEFFLSSLLCHWFDFIWQHFLGSMSLPLAPLSYSSWYMR